MENKEDALGVRKLLPTRLRVAASSLEQDAVDLLRAVRSRRTRSHRECRSFRYETADGQTIEVEVEYTVPPPTTDVVAVLEFAESGVVLNVSDPEATILELGLEAGVDLLFSCAVGGCAACLLDIVSGEVDYEDRDGICLDDDEIDDGLCLACVGRPRGHLVVNA